MLPKYYVLPSSGRIQFVLLLFIALQGRVCSWRGGRLCLKRMERGSERMAKWLSSFYLLAYATVLSMEPAISEGALKTNTG